MNLPDTNRRIAPDGAVIEAMPRPRPLHLQREKTRHGNFVWYVRRGQGPRIRIRSEFGTEEFSAEYEAALAGAPAPAKPRVKSGSLQWLYDRYRETAAWSALSVATRRQRENIFVGVMASAGTEPYTTVQKKDIEAGKNRRASTPSQARNFLDAVRGLFRWALETEHVTEDPTAGVKNPPKPKGKGFPIWTEEEVELYEAKWPVGTKERVWLDVLLYTGLRRGDAVVIGKQHVRNGVAILRTEKSQGETTVTIPILPVLARTLAAGPCSDLAFICGDRGKPLTKETFGNVFRVACNSAGVKKSAHGIRKIATTRAANNGATTAQMKAIFGWENDAMPALYGKNADRAKLARDAMSMLLRTPEEQSIPEPPGEGAGCAENK